MGDQDIIEYYHASYVMSEMNFGKWLMLLPGIRYEATNATMKGMTANQPTLAGPINDPLPGKADTAKRSDHFLLPMIQAKITATNFMYFHFAYTQTLSRPNFDVISPNTYVNTGFAPLSYVTRKS